MKKNTVQVSSRVYQELPCIQNAGHVGGKRVPCIVLYRGRYCKLIDDDAFGGPLMEVLDARPQGVIYV